MAVWLCYAVCCVRTTGPGAVCHPLTSKNRIELADHNCCGEQLFQRACTLITQPTDTRHRGRKGMPQPQVHLCRLRVRRRLHLRGIDGCSLRSVCGVEEKICAIQWWWWWFRVSTSTPLHWTGQRGRQHPPYQALHRTETGQRLVVPVGHPARLHHLETPGCTDSPATASTLQSPLRCGLRECVRPTLKQKK